jgi:hypothetical protein
MSSIIKVDTIQNQSGANIISESSNTITVGASGDTINFGGNVGTISGQNYPAFYASLSADQTFSDITTVKVQFNNEAFDTDSIYDNSTNYRITIPSGKAGKYYIKANVFIDAQAVSNLNRAVVYIYKNNSVAVQSFQDYRNNPSQKINVNVSAIMDLAVGDYIEIFAYGDTDNSGTGVFRGDGSVSESWFQGFRIGD